MSPRNSAILLPFFQTVIRRYLGESPRSCGVAQEERVTEVFYGCGMLAHAGNLRVVQARPPRRHQTVK